MAARECHIVLLEPVWNWAKELLIKPEELKIDEKKKKSKFDQTVCHMAARQGHVKVLETLWEWAKDLQLRQNELIYVL
jgi:predicted nucleic acid-binding Zn ribbon protein